MGELKSSFSEIDGVAVGYPRRYALGLAGGIQLGIQHPLHRRLRMENLSSTSNGPLTTPASCLSRIGGMVERMDWRAVRAGHGPTGHMLGGNKRTDNTSHDGSFPSR